MNNEKHNISFDDIDEIDWCDYPYLGIGRKPISKKKQTPTCEQLERVIAG